MPELSAASLGSPAFRRRHGLRLAYVAGAMVKGIASVDLVTRMARAGLLSFYGSGGQRLEVLEAELDQLQRNLQPGQPYGVNFLHNMLMPSLEDAVADILLARGITTVEAAAFVDLTPALVRYRVTGLTRGGDGQVLVRNRILAKASRAEVAERFMNPPPAEILDALRARGAITQEEASLAARIPMADDLCGEADSGGHTDKRVAWALLPEFVRVRDRVQARHRYAAPPVVGLAGGLGSPEAIAGAFLLGAGFVLTGSINQCTVEAGTSDAVKDLLAAAGTQDFEMAPAGDMFEIGARVQVLRRGVLFPARANRLYDLYRQHDSLDALPAPVRRTIEQTYLGRSFDSVWQETRGYYARVAPQEVERAEANPKQKMAMTFRFYHIHSNRLAMSGDAAHQADYQVHAGPAVGAFNEWARGTKWESWRHRHVDEIGQALMDEAAVWMNQRYAQLTQGREDGE